MADPTILQQYDTPEIDKDGKTTGNIRVIVYSDGRIEGWKASPGQDPQTHGVRVALSDNELAIAREHLNAARADRTADRQDRRDEDARKREEERQRNEDARRAETERHNRETERNQAAASARADTRAAQQQRQQASAAEATRKQQELVNAITQRKMGREEADAEWDRWVQENITIPSQQAAQARADFSTRRGVYESDRAFNTSNEREERRRFEVDRKFGYDAGQDAVSAHLREMPYRMAVGPGFAGNFAAGVNGLSAGSAPTTFQASDFVVQPTNYGALAEMGRAVAGAPPAGPPATAANVPVGPPPAVPSAPSLALPAYRGPTVPPSSQGMAPPPVAPAPVVPEQPPPGLTPEQQAAWHAQRAGRGSYAGVQ